MMQVAQRIVDVPMDGVVLKCSHALLSSPYRHPRAVITFPPFLVFLDSEQAEAYRLALIDEMEKRGDDGSFPVELTADVTVWGTKDEHNSLFDVIVCMILLSNGGTL